MDFIDTVEYFWSTCDHKRVELKTSRIQCAGYGVFATVDLSEGEIVGVYEGKKYTKDKVFSGETTKYVFQYNSGGHVFQIVPEKGCLMRYINDVIDLEVSRMCERFVARSGIDYNVDWYQHDGEVYIVAQRDIKCGEELYIDYGRDYWKWATQPQKSGEIIYNNIIRAKRELSQSM